jgi:hypothetical protein
MSFKWAFAYRFSPVLTRFSTVECWRRADCAGGPPIGCTAAREEHRKDGCLPHDL